MSAACTYIEETYTLVEKYTYAYAHTMVANCSVLKSDSAQL